MTILCKASIVSLGISAIFWSQYGCREYGADSAPSPAELSRDSLMVYLAGEARKITDRAKSETASRQAWEAVQDERRSELKDMLGLADGPARTPLHAQIKGRIEHDGYVIEKIAFESMPRVWVTANLYLPSSTAEPVPGVIYVCGHAYSPHGAKTSYQRHGHTLARHGYAAMVIDPIQIAETAGLHHGVFNQEMYEWYTRAYSPAGLEVWNAIRALDYMETRPEIDRDRFAITGRSGGAAMSWFTAAVEPRIKAVVPIMGIATYAVTVPDNTQRLHCDCMYPVNLYGHDPIHLGSLIAPRPLFTAHGREDPLFPVAGYEEFAVAMTNLYGSYGEPDRFRNLVVETGHEDSDFLRAEALKWLDRWLMGRDQREIETAFEGVEAEDLAVFGGEPPVDAENYRAHEFFVPAPNPLRWTNSDEWATRRDEFLKALRNTVFRSIPDGLAVPESGPGRMAAPEGYEPISFLYDGGIEVQTLLRMPEQPDGPALLHVASPGEDPDAVRLMLRNLGRFGENPVMVVYPPGTGDQQWSKSDWKMLLRNAMHTGRTVDSLRIGSVLAAAKLLQTRVGLDRTITASGVGQAAAWVVYAAALDETIGHVILIRVPSSLREGPILLGASRHGDLPDIASLLAPRRLTFYGSMPESYARTQEIYEGMDVGSKLSVSMSIGVALNRRFDHGFSIGL